MAWSSLLGGSRLCWQALLALLLVSGTSACIYLMGEAPNSVVHHPAGTHWTYGLKGDDWIHGVDANNKSWDCAIGHRQSPIQVHDLPTLMLASPQLKTHWQYTHVASNGTNIQVYNNGHTIQVQWSSGTLQSQVQIPAAGHHITDVLAMSGGQANHSSVRMVTATPTQFHFHTDSEHVLDGRHHALEMHIVHTVPQSQLPGCPAAGCITATSVMFKLDAQDKDNPALESIFSVMPAHEGLMVDMPEGRILDIQALLPANRSCVQYEGSLTTPPCTEGLLWHVFLEPQTMSLRQLRSFMSAVGFKKCEQPNIRGLSSTRHLRAFANPFHIVGNDFQRGGFSGFRHVPVSHASDLTRRALLASDGVGCPESWNCSIIAYGANNRLPQPLHDRVVLKYL